MNDLFTGLLLLSILGLIIGLVSPKLFRIQSRSKAGLIFGVVIVVCFTLFGMTTPPTQAPEAISSSVSTSSSPNNTPNQVTNKPTPAKTQSISIPVVIPKPTPPEPPQPATLLDIKGSGSKSTQIFNVLSKNWQLDWSYNCSNFGYQGNFQVYIYNSDGSISSNWLINQMGDSGADTEYYHSAGSYYLEVNSMCNWTLKVRG